MACSYSYLHTSSQMSPSRSAKIPERSFKPIRKAGAAVYTPFHLFFYDLCVLWITNRFAWKCSTSKILLPLFQSTIGERHLDVGVGTGYFPANSLGPSSRCKEITLVDLNSSALGAAKHRIVAASSRQKLKVNGLIADATKPLPV